MKLLVVLANNPFPPRTGSSIVAYNIIKQLSERHYVNLICYQSMPASIGVPDFAIDYEFVYGNKKTKFARWLFYLFDMILGRPPWISAASSHKMAEKVRDKISNAEFDAVLLFEMSAIQYCPESIFNRLFVNIEDPQSLKLFRMIKLPIWSFWQRVKLFVRAKLTLNYEKCLLPNMAKVFLLSRADIRDMEERGVYKNLAHVPYAVNQQCSKSIVSYEDRKRAIVFSGNMFHPPNIDAGIFLLREIFPLVLRDFPSAILWIVGANPDARIYEAAAKFGKQVVITGGVDDISSYIKSAMVSICPVRLEIGVQTKILEALSWGTPVVTTSAGNRGVAGMSGTHLWVEDDVELLAKRVCNLLEGKDWQHISESGRRFVTERFTWRDSAAQLEHYIEASFANYG